LIRFWAVSVLTIAVSLIVICLITLLPTDKWSEGRWVWWTCLSGSFAILPAAIAARRGIKWGVAATALIVVTGLVALSALSGFFALRIWPKQDSFWIVVAALGFASFVLWLGWRYASHVLSYLRSGDRALLFSDYRRNFSKPARSFGTWMNLKRALPNKRIKALVWASSLFQQA
jgi:hypothetical protein